MIPRKRLIIVFLTLLISIQLNAQQKSIGYYENALSFVNSGNNQAAMYELNKVLNLDPNNLDAINLRAFIYLKLEQKELALDDYRTMLKIQPNNEGALINASLILMELERFEEALALLDKRVKAYPENWSAWYDRAYCLGLMNNHRDAISNFDKAIELNANDASAFANRGFSKVNLYSNLGLTQISQEEKIDVCRDLTRAQSMGDTTVTRVIKKYCE